MKNGIEIGDIEFASYSAWNTSNNLFLSGKNLDIIGNKVTQYIEIMQKLKLTSVALIISAIKQSVQNLQNNSLNRYSLIGDTFNEVEMLTLFEGNATWFSIFTIAK